MAYKRLSEHVNEVLAGKDAKPALPETRHIETTREHDISQLMQQQERSDEPKPQRSMAEVMHYLTQAERRQEPAHDHARDRQAAAELIRQSDTERIPDHSAARESASARMLAAQEHAKRQQTVRRPPLGRSIQKQIQGLRGTFRYPS